MSTRVLVVEPFCDDGGLAEGLSGAGMRVERTTDSPSAAAAIASSAYGAAIIDLATPNLDVEAILGALADLPSRPIVLLVGDDFAGDGRRFSAEVVQGLIRRSSATDWVPEWLAECVSAFRAAANPQPALRATLSRGAGEGR